MYFLSIDADIRAYMRQVNKNLLYEKVGGIEDLKAMVV